MLIELAEQGKLPDFLLRGGAKCLVGLRLLQERERNAARQAQKKEQLISLLKSAPVAVEQQAANEQHYEVPAAFYQYALGPNRKYSCCYWPEGASGLAEAEDASLQQICDRAEIKDGMEILELGCGWGSLSLWLARRYPNARITGVSNSNSQRQYIEQEIQRSGLTNLNILTADIVELSLDKQFDRVVSIEMFEHMRNYQALLEKVSRWLKSDGKLFVHVFCHKEFAYFFETEGSSNWLGKYFFTGGIMPSRDLFQHFQQHFLVSNVWDLSGTHYEKTANAWLENLDANKGKAMEVLRQTYGSEAEIWFNRWRLFFIACAELFGFNGGAQWGVVHYLFDKKS